eukprot:6097635-Amphidinium_carterae.1
MLSLSIAKVCRASKGRQQAGGSHLDSLQALALWRTGAGGSLESGDVGYGGEVTYTSSANGGGVRQLWRALD